MTNFTVFATSVHYHELQKLSTWQLTRKNTQVNFFNLHGRNVEHRFFFLFNFNGNWYAKRKKHFFCLLLRGVTSCSKSVLTAGVNTVTITCYCHNHVKFYFAHHSAETLKWVKNTVANSIIHTLSTAEKILFLFRCVNYSISDAYAADTNSSPGPEEWPRISGPKTATPKPPKWGLCRLPHVTGWQPFKRTRARLFHDLSGGPIWKQYQRCLENLMHTRIWGINLLLFNKTSKIDIKFIQIRGYFIYPVATVPYICMEFVHQQSGFQKCNALWHI